jgi:hypothetical protein
MPSKHCLLNTLYLINIIYWTPIIGLSDALLKMILSNLLLSLIIEHI